MNAPHRRRFQFGLRQLLLGIALLAIPLGWLGWQAHIVRERHAFLEWTRQGPPWHTGTIVIDCGTVTPVSLWRSCFGERAQIVVMLPAQSTKADTAKARSLFPEASVIGPE